MYQSRRVAIVIPAHNEAAHIAQVLRKIPDFADWAIVVDDASTDGTSEAALAVADPRLILLRNDKNQGLGGTMIAGYRKAMELNADILVKVDGDDQMDLSLLTHLIDPLVEQGYDYAKGNRFLAAESLSFMPKHRLLGNIGMTFLTKMASGYWNIFDPQNGYTAIKVSALRAIDLEKLHRGFFFENDILCHLNLIQGRVKDVAMPAKYGEEVSDLNPFHVGLTFPLLLLRRFARRVYQRYILRDFSPIALFLFSGLLTFGWGLGFGLYLWIHAIVTGTAQPTPTGTIMLALLPMILGFQLLLQAVLLDIQETPK